MNENKNPFDKKKQDRLWSTWEDQQNYKKLSQNFSTFELDEWDINFFIPEIWERLKYVDQILRDFKKMCLDQDLARDLDVRLRPILSPVRFNMSLPEPKVGEQYLSAVNEMIENQYLNLLKDFFERYHNFKAEPDITHVFNFLNESRFIFDMIVQTKNDPFTYHFKAFPSVKNIKTGEVIADDPIEISITLKPFEVKINELVNVCKRTYESIDLWVNKRRESKNELIKFALSQSQVDVAFYQKKSNKWATLFQICTILFAVAVIVLGDRTTLYFENQDLNKELSNSKITLSKKGDEIEKIKHEIDTKNEIILNLQNEIKLFKKNKP